MHTAIGICCISREKKNSNPSVGFCVHPPTPPELIRGYNLRLFPSFGRVYSHWQLVNFYPANSRAILAGALGYIDPEPRWSSQPHREEQMQSDGQSAERSERTMCHCRVTTEHRAHSPASRTLNNTELSKLLIIFRIFETK